MHSGVTGQRPLTKLGYYIVLFGFIIPMFALMLIGWFQYPSRQNMVPNNSSIVFALQHVQRGDIIWFGDRVFRMVEVRDGDEIRFKVPTSSELAMIMDLKQVAREAKGVIKYNSFSVTWNNAAYMLMTGYDPSKPRPTFPPSK